MTETCEWLNIAKAESDNNTLTYESFEVPNSAGAKAVILEDIMADLTEPSYVANTKVFVEGSILRGKQIPGNANLDQTGCVFKIQNLVWGNASEVIAIGGITPSQREGPFEIPKSPDGKFYITICVKSYSETKANTMSAHLEFSVIR